MMFSKSKCVDGAVGAGQLNSRSGRTTAVPDQLAGPSSAAVDSIASTGDWPNREDFHSYVEAIAHARFVIRRAMRIADEEARQRGLEPLQHQVLLQVYGTSEPLSIRAIADRMDVVPAFASRLVKNLEDLGYIARHADARDKRVSYVTATDTGIALLREIDAEVQVHVAYFQRQLSSEARLAALVTFGFYVGLSADSTVARAIESARAELGQGRAQPVRCGRDRLRNPGVTRMKHLGKRSGHSWSGSQKQTFNT